MEEEEVTAIPGWTPEVTLEVQDTVETGEEDEEELYSQRSKLFRFRDKEWKERGLGDAKLLKHKKTGKVRFMLRQEKTMKIVGNFYVVDVASYCELKPNAGSEKSWVWLASDCSDGEPKAEQLALKFATKELAVEFKDAFEEAKVLNKAVKEFASLNDDAPKTSPEKKDMGGVSSTTGTLFPASSAASSPAPLFSLGSTTSAGFSVGSSSSTSATFGSAPGAPSSEGAAMSAPSTLFQASSVAPAPGSLFSSGSNPFAGISFGSSSTSSAFSSGSGAAGLFSSSGATSSFFGSTSWTTGASGSSPFAGSSLFSQPTRSGIFGEPASASKPAEPDAKEKATQEEEEVEEEEVTAIPGWTPEVTLEVQDNVETGEEDEEELYSQRSKLFRFRDKEWKERGLGDAKLLKHKKTGKVRFMLRQEKTMKIVGNFYVVDVASYCELKPNAGSEKSWVWLASDCSDGEPKAEQLALKFATKELALKFKDAFEEAKVLNRAVKEFATLNSDDVSSVPGKENARDACGASAPGAPLSQGPAMSAPSTLFQASSVAPAPGSLFSSGSNPFAGVSFGSSSTSSAFSSGSGAAGLFSSLGATSSFFGSTSWTNGSQWVVTVCGIRSLQSASSADECRDFRGTSVGVQASRACCEGKHCQKRGGGSGGGRGHSHSGVDS